jgi:hypothetical protein
LTRLGKGIECPKPDPEQLYEELSEERDERRCIELKRQDDPEKPQWVLLKECIPNGDSTSAFVVKMTRNMLLGEDTEQMCRRDIRERKKNDPIKKDWIITD